MIPLCNLHTHTTYCDGKNTAEEMVQKAIECGAATLGFSGHSPLFINRTHEEWSMRVKQTAEYQAEVLRLRQIYGGQIEILLGIEQDYFSDLPEFPYDYVIGSVHYVKKGNVYIPMDLDPGELKKAIDTLYAGDAIALAKDYFSLVADVYQKTSCQIIGHFDLLTKFNEKQTLFDESDSSYRKAALEAVDALLEEDVLFEINTGAMSRGWRTSPYPAPFILRYLADKKARLIVTGDSHSTEALFFGYEDAYRYAESCGVKELFSYYNGNFQAFYI